MAVYAAFFRPEQTAAHQLKLTEEQWVDLVRDIEGAHNLRTRRRIELTRRNVSFLNWLQRGNSISPLGSHDSILALPSPNLPPTDAVFDVSLYRVASLPI